MSNVPSDFPSMGMQFNKWFTQRLIFVFANYCRLQDENQQLSTKQKLHKDALRHIKSGYDNAAGIHEQACLEKMEYEQLAREMDRKIKVRSSLSLFPYPILFIF